MRTVALIACGAVGTQIALLIVSQLLLQSLQVHIELRLIERGRQSNDDFDELLQASRYTKVVKVVYCTARWYHYPLCGLYRWYLRSQARRQP